MKCPKCGSKKLAPILYGMPAFDEEMKRKLDNRELVLGGCGITGADPQYHCFGCYRDVCKPPVLITGRDREDYRDIVTSVRFFDWCFNDTPSSVVIKKTDGGAIRLEASSADGFIKRELREAEWKRLLDRLYGRLYLHEWKKRYDNLFVLDGEEWELEIKLTGGRIRTYKGNNAYPPYWMELKETFKPFLKRPDDPLGGSGRQAGK